MILTPPGMITQFDVIVSASDGVASKPDPEGYIRAAKLLGVRPSDCIVFEDSAQGVAAGKQAGMFVVGIRNKGEQDLSKADVCVPTLAIYEKLYIDEFYRS